MDLKGQKNAQHVRLRRPFWLPASNYYVLAAAASIAFFFLFWGILQSGGGDSPWIPSGVGASIILFGAVILREVILRRARDQYLRNERQLDRNLSKAYSQIGDRRIRQKLSVEKNAAILNEIKKKSDAANVLSKFSGAHREVFELCGEYIVLNEKELRSVRPGSPRIGPLIKGRSAANEYHRHHLLKWAEIESRSLTNEAQSRTDFTEKAEAAEMALRVIHTALEHYPAEHSLLESRDVLLDMIVSINVSDLVQQAEMAAFGGEYKQAVVLYREALFHLGRDKVSSESREQAARHINAEIDRMRHLEEGN